MEVTDLEKRHLIAAHWFFDDIGEILYNKNGIQIRYRLDFLTQKIEVFI